MEHIYTIITLRKPILGEYGGSRCVGWYPTFKQTEQAVVQNHQDIYELGHYPYCVIEKIGFGVYCLNRKEYWYKWDENLDKYIKLYQKPDIFSGISCSSIG